MRSCIAPLLNYSMPLKHYDSGNEKCGIYACVPVTPAHSVPGITAERVGGIGGVVAPYMVPLGFLFGPSHTKHSSFKPSCLSHLNEERERGGEGPARACVFSSTS